MTISATGNKRRAARGFTLIELLVILVILALLSGIVMMALPRGESDAARAARRLAMGIETLADMAVMDGRPRGVALTEGGGPAAYVYGAEGWSPAHWPGDEPMTDDGLRLSLTTTDGFGLKVEEAEGDLLFRRRDVEDEEETDDDESDRLDAPDILMDATGEVTGFTFTIEDRDTRFVVEGVGNGAVEVRNAPQD